MLILSGVKIQQRNNRHVLRIRKSYTITSSRSAGTFTITFCWSIRRLEIISKFKLLSITRFQITSFRATTICGLTSDGSNFEATFKIEFQVYHKIRSLISMPIVNPKIFQIYLMGICEKCLTNRWQYNFIEQTEEKNCGILERFRRSIRLFKRLLTQ
jgi:hypothetical protein